MNLEEKKDQVLQAANGGQDPVNDLDVLIPEDKIFILGNKEYIVKSIPMKKMRALIQLTKLNFLNTEDIDKIIDIFSLLLGEPDKDFIENNLDVPKLNEYTNIVTELIFKGVPKLSDKEKKTPGNSVTDSAGRILS